MVSFLQRIVLLILPIFLAVGVFHWPQWEERAVRWLTAIDWEGCYGLAPTGFLDLMVNLWTTQTTCRELTMDQMERILESRSLSVVVIFWTSHSYYTAAEWGSLYYSGYRFQIKKTKHQCEWLHKVVYTLALKPTGKGSHDMKVPWITLNAAYKENDSFTQWLELHDVSATTTTSNINGTTTFRNNQTLLHNNDTAVVDRGYIYPCMLVFSHGKPVRRYMDKGTPYKYACDKPAITAFLNKTFHKKLAWEKVFDE